MIRAMLLIVVVASTATPALATGVLRPRAGGAPIPAASRRVTVVIEDGIAEMTVRETFLPAAKEPFEALYEAPMPESAVLTGAEVRTGGLTLTSAPAPWREVREIRDRILAESGRPVPVTGAPYRCRRLPVSPVIPGESVVVTQTWLFEVPLRGGSYTVHLPLLPPVGAKRGPQVAVEVTLRSSVPISSVHTSREGSATKRPDRHTAIVGYAGIAPGTGESLSVEAVVETLTPDITLTTYRSPGERGWFRAVITPPTIPPKDSVPRDVVLVLDTSGSMRGRRIENMRAAVHYLLRHLRPVDRVNIVHFANLVRAFAPGPVEASPANLRRLRRFVDAMDAGGGTALGDALRQAVAVEPAPGRVRTLVLLTDGVPTKGVTGTREILTFARNGRAAGFRIYCFGILSPGRGWLLSLIARAGGGECWFLSPDEEIRSRLTAFLERSSTPILTDLVFDPGEPTTSEVLPLILPDVFIGEQLVVTGRYSTGGTREFTLTGRFGVRPIEIRNRIDWRTGAGGPDGVARRHESKKMALLGVSREFRKRLTPEDYLRVLREHRIVWPGNEEIEMRRLARRFGWEAPGTDLVLVRPADRNLLQTERREDLEQALAGAETARREALAGRGLSLAGPRPPAGSWWERFGRVDIAVGGPPHR